MAIKYLDAKRIRGTSTSVKFDAQAYANTASNGTTLTVSLAVANNDNRILIVSSGNYNASPTVSGITYGSQNLIKIDDDIIGSDGRCELWYLLAPTVGTATITVTYSGTAGRRGIGGMCFYDVAQTAPVNAVTASSTSGTTVGGNVTPTTAGSAIVDGMSDISGSSNVTLSLTAGWHQFIGGSDRGQGAQYDLSPTIGSANTMNYTLPGSAGWAWVGCEIKAIGSADATKAALIPTVFEQLTGGGGITFAGAGTRQQLTQQFNAGHALIGETISKCSFFVSKSSGTPTGTLVAFLKNKSTSSGSSGTITAISTSLNSFAAGDVDAAAEYAFTFTPHTIVAGDMVVVGNPSGGNDSNLLNCVTGSGTMTNGICYKVESGESYVEVSGEKLKITVTPDAKIPENTIFEETDTYKTYWLQSNATWMEQIPPMTYMVMAGKSGSPKDKIDRVAIATNGNATSFGTLNIGREKPTGLSNESRGLICGGEPAQAITDIESIMIGTGAQSADYGDLVSIRQRAGGVNAATIDRGLVGGGISSGNTAVIDYLTIGTGGTAGDFGDLTQARAWVAEAWSDTIGCFCNGYTSSAVDTMDYVTMATLGNATDFGNSTVGRYSSDGLTDKTRGVICGGYSSSQLDVMDYITIDTPANATDFGNLSDSAENSYAGGDLKTKGLIASNQLTVLTEIQQITVATAANSTSFGELDTCTNDGCVMNGI